MKGGEFSGHSIDEAVFHGLMELGLSIDEVNIETLQNESKGLFGIGAKMARVRLTQREPEALDTLLSVQEEERREGYVRRDGSRDVRSRSDRSPGDRSHGDRSHGDRSHGDRSRSDRSGGSSGGSSRGNYDGGDRQQSAYPETGEDAALQQYAYDKELAQTHAAGKFLTGLLERMQIEADVLAAETEDGIRLRIDSATKGLLIGRRGETLDALQYITSLSINRTNKQDKYQRVTIDTEDYRSKREETLSRLARRQAARVKSSGRSVAMEPMNPYERRILHSSLQNNPHVTTYSEGEEPNRRVVIAPKH